MCTNWTVLEPGQKNMKFIFYLCRTKSTSVLPFTDSGFAVTLWHQQPHPLICTIPAIAAFWKALPTFGFPGSDGKVFPCTTTAAVTNAVQWPCFFSEGRTCCWLPFYFEAENYFWMPQGWVTSLSSNLQPQDSVPFVLLLQFYFFRIKEEASEHMLKHLLNVFPFCAEHRLDRNLVLFLPAFRV